MPFVNDQTQHGVIAPPPPPPFPRSLYQQPTLPQQHQQPQPQLAAPQHLQLGQPQMPMQYQMLASQLSALPQPPFVGGLPSGLPQMPNVLPLSVPGSVQMLYSVQVGPNGVPVLLPLNSFPSGAAPTTSVLPPPPPPPPPMPQPQYQGHYQQQPPPVFSPAAFKLAPSGMPAFAEHTPRQVHGQYVGTNLRPKAEFQRGGLAQPHPQHQHHQQQQQLAAANGATREVTVIDPTLHVGKVAIPYHLTLPTRGRAEWDRGTSRRDLSLCCLFQRGRCHAADGCHQIHADREFVATMRERQAAAVSCCVSCGDTLPTRNPFCRAFFFGVTTVHVIDTAAPGGPRTWTLHPKQLAYTVGLQDQFTHDGCGIEAGVATVSLSSICRLQRRGACKYGKDCKRVHVCSKVPLDGDVAPAVAAADVEEQLNVSNPAAAAAVAWESEHSHHGDPQAELSQGTYALDEAGCSSFSPPESEGKSALRLPEVPFTPALQ